MNLQYILLGLILIISCKSNTNKDEKEEKLIEESNKEEEVAKENSKEFITFCFYQLDDKYSNENDSIKIQEWIKKESDIIKTGKLNSNDLFDHNAGGPNGAEWNAGTHIYLVIQQSPSSVAENPKIWINGKPFYDKSIYESKDLKWFLIRKEYWYNQLRDVNSADIKDLYPDPEIQNAIKNEEYEPYVGQVLRFDISYENLHRITKYFHVAYGE
ncbi:hypothetical protein [Aquimarina algiphila]|uniref:Uncharacterized protein n=1 Tax=Aquimarina algiphila TaxID=2047982 RepID=A0A554VDE9_9FLAO|nr:hypothetical protein [Aquimarina algiphila]TSE04885.1 hypothetical protein FOF46_24685 [Aquimarina algiphila]